MARLRVIVIQDGELMDGLTPAQEEQELIGAEANVAEFLSMVDPQEPVMVVRNRLTDVDGDGTIDKYEVQATATFPV